MGRFKDVRRFGEIDSTNRWVAEQARGGATEGLVAVAGMQSAGRGRLDRTWIAPAGSALLCTVLVRPQMPMARWHWLNLAMAVAAQDAIRLLGEAFVELGSGSEFSSGGDSVTDAGRGARADAGVGADEVLASGSNPIGSGSLAGQGHGAVASEGGVGALGVAVKWPNDLIVPSMGDRKLAGILAEMVLPANGHGAVAVGIGLNVRRPFPVDPEVASRGVWLNELICAPTNVSPEAVERPAEPPILHKAPSSTGSNGGSLRNISSRPEQGLTADKTLSADQTSSPTVDEVLSVLLTQFERQVAEVEDRPDAFLETYRQRCITVGREVRAMLPSSDIIGTATGIDSDGQLLVTTRDGNTHAISAADVIHIRPAV